MHRSLRRLGFGVLAVAVGVLPLVSPPGRRFAGGALTLILGMLPVVPPAASAVTPDGRPTVEVVARKLNNPRGLVVTPEGIVLVAEAGLGGDGPCRPSPESPNGDVCLGRTGSVTSISPDGQRRLITGLPSLAAKGGTNALGPSDVSLGGSGVLLVSFGFGANLERRTALGPGGAELGTVRAFKMIPLFRASWTLADITAYEEKENPDGGEHDNNPNAVLALDDGGAVVVDAGGNSLLSIDKRSVVKPLAVFPSEPVPAPPGRVGEAAPRPIQSVPTSVARGPDGALYVGELSGFPYQKGAARVWRVVPGELPTVYARGFTSIIDLAFDRHGRLYVLEIAKEGLKSGDRAGALIRVERDGRRTELLSRELTSPGGLAFGPSGSLFIANHATSPGEGEVLLVSV